MATPTIIQMNFPHQGPWGDGMTAAFGDLARSINDEPGFLWKVWIEEQADGTSGGIYASDTREHAEAYAAMHRARMEQMGVSGIEVRFSDVNVALSRLNHAAIG